MNRKFLILSFVVIVSYGCEEDQPPYQDWVGIWEYQPYDPPISVTIDLVDGYPSIVNFFDPQNESFSTWYIQDIRFRNDVLTCKFQSEGINNSWITYDNSFYLISASEITWDFLKFTHGVWNGKVIENEYDSSITLIKRK